MRRAHALQVAVHVLVGPHGTVLLVPAQIYRHGVPSAPRRRAEIHPLLLVIFVLMVDQAVGRLAAMFVLLQLHAVNGGRPGNVLEPSGEPTHRAGAVFLQQGRDPAVLARAVDAQLAGFWWLPNFHVRIFLGNVRRPAKAHIGKGAHDALVDDGMLGNEHGCRVPARPGRGGKGEGFTID